MGPLEGSGRTFLITANRFLHHMVRYVVGTMAEMAANEDPFSTWFHELLSDPGTALTTSAPAPPEGLFLSKVHYHEPLSELDLGFPPTPSQTL